MLRLSIFARAAGTIAVAFTLSAAAAHAAAQASASPSPSPSPSPTAKPVYQDMHWRELGPGLMGGRAANVAGSAKNINLYYVAAAGGGVWKTTDGGETWNAVFEKETVASIGDVAIDPSNDDVVWVGTGEGNPRNDVIPGGGVYKSIDGGKTWTAVGLQATRSITRLLIDPHNPNHVLVAALGDTFAPSADRGIYVTDDGGRSWKKTLYLGDQSGGSDLAWDPGNPNVVYAGMWHFQRKPWTTNSGGADDGLFKSTDGGHSWTQLTGHGLPADTIGRIGLAVAASNPKRVYALIESTQGILWRSDDAGANWTMVSNDPLVDQRPFYFSHIYVDPKDADHVYGVSMMLASSHDGGKTFKGAFNAPHGDFHGMWIAPNDPRRIMVAEDGGVARTLDGGETWFFDRNLPIGEVYHVGVGLAGNPYWVCGGWQDNNAWCGPAFNTDPGGVQNKHWIAAAGGDGEWAIPDPLDPDVLWADSQDGVLSIYNLRTRDQYVAQPYFATGAQQFDISTAKYRFNWDSPIAFAPWNPHIAWLGGNVVFQTSDRGRTWKVISPDLTRNEKDHQQPSGGPITHDVSSAENYNTILDIEGSTLRRGEIWVSTDDGQVQMTLDGGRHWRNVTPNSAPDHGAAETVAPSTTNDGTVYASFDKHLLGDYAPYLFVTHDFGKTWTSIAKGIPDGQYARSIRQDARNRNIVYAGTETGFWISCDAGTTWHDFKNDLPTVSVRDIRYQPQWDDMVIATHGRGIYVMDDLRPLQYAACAKPKAAFVLPPRLTYQYNVHADDEGTYTDWAAPNPPYGVSVSYYQPSAGKTDPVIRIYDANHRLIRTVSGMKSNLFGPGKPEPWIKNAPGLQQFTWSMATDGPVKWNGGGKFFKGPDEGITVPPGRYTLAMTISGRTYTLPCVIKADPGTHFTQAELQASYDYGMHFLARLSTLDTALNALDDVKTHLNALRADAVAKHDTATVATIDAQLANRQKWQDAVTANFQGFEDFILRPGKLREDLVQSLQVGLVTPAAVEAAERIDRTYGVAMTQYNAYVAALPAFNATMKAGGYDPIALPPSLH